MSLMQKDVPQESVVKNVLDEVPYSVTEDSARV